MKREKKEKVHIDDPDKLMKDTRKTTVCGEYTNNFHPGMRRPKRGMIPMKPEDPAYVEKLKAMIDEAHGSIPVILMRTNLLYKNWQYLASVLPWLEEYRQTAFKYAIDQAESKLTELVEVGHFQAIKFLLERSADKYEEKKTIRIVAPKLEEFKPKIEE